MMREDWSSWWCGGQRSPATSQHNHLGKSLTNILRRKLYKWLQTYFCNKWERCVALKFCGNLKLQMDESWILERRLSESTFILFLKFSTSCPYTRGSVTLNCWNGPVTGGPKYMLVKTQGLWHRLCWFLRLPWCQWSYFRISDSSKFHHLALLVTLVSCSLNFHLWPLFALLVALVLYQDDSADLNFAIL